MSEDFARLSPEELQERLEELAGRIRPLDRQLAELKAQRDQLLTERRRRDRQAHREARADLKAAMQRGEFPTVADLVAAAREGGLDDYAYSLKTGGEVRLGFPDARQQTLTFTDGRQVAQAKDFAEAGRCFEAGWELGSPGRPGVRVHFPGTRLERLVDPAEVFARPA
ncbi:MAG TPA: hypothetical protein VK131_03990 [Candidatus Acidoferrales bacterium]|nr:hypothetical protein [Candidatus Acidoferrales bacterium]